MDHPQTAPTANTADPDWLSLCLLALAAFSIGLAINIREGLFCRGALIGLSVAIVASFATLIRFRIRPAPWQQRLPAIVLTAALAVQFIQLYRGYPGSLWNTSPSSPQRQLSVLKDDLTWIKVPAERHAAKSRIDQLESSLKTRPFQLGILLAAALTPLTLLRRPSVRHSAFALILLVHFCLGAHHLRRTHDPFIDVYVFQQESPAALLRAQNPYASTFTNIYGPDAYVYAPNLMKDGRVNFGYPYTPLSLFMTLPGYAATGDSRFSQLAAITLAAALLFYARPSSLAALAALLLLFTPRAFNVVELAWTEPFVVLLLAATIFSACRFPRATPYVFGLLLASKQYTILLIPLAVLLSPAPFRCRDYLRLILKAGIVAAAVSLPLALWNLPAFIRSALTLQLKQPFRKDSISYLALLAWQNWRYAQPLAVKLAVLAFLAAAAAIIITLKRCPRTPAGFALGASLVYLAFLALNKQAFCNYYFLVIGALCSAIAATRPPRPFAHPPPSAFLPPSTGLPHPRLPFPSCG